MATVDDLIATTLRRLALPRVGLLWWHETAPKRFDAPPQATWIHYLAPGCVFPRELRPAYRLSLLSEPEEEASTLNMLVIPSARIELLGDLLEGLPVSPEGRLAAGCLGAGLPVLVDVSAIARWTAWKGAIGRRHRESMARLEELGCLLLGVGETKPLEADRTGGDLSEALLLEEPGWTSWGEIASRLGRKRVVRIRKGVRLTAEALDRLRSLGIVLKREG